MKLFPEYAAQNMGGPIIALGELLVDLLPGENNVKISEPGGVIKTASGSSGIFACAVARLGAKSGFLGKIGKDSLSQMVHEIIAAEGVDLSHAVLSDEGKIGLAFIEYLKDERNYQYYRNDSVGSKYAASDVDKEYLSSAFALHYSGMLLELSPQMQSACLYAAEIARNNGILISFDPNIRKELLKSDQAMDRLKAAVKNADIITPTLEEAKFITKKDTIGDILQDLHTMGPKVVALTRDKDGAILSANHKVAIVDGIKADIIDPTGAGDTFAAALIYCVQQGYSLEEAACFCNCAGVCTCMKRGSIGTALPDLEQVKQMMNSGVCSVRSSDIADLKTII